MNNPLQNARRLGERGSLLVTAAVSSAVIAVLVAGMLTYITNEYRLNLRSHRWNQALYLAEAGVDVSFAEVNNYYLTGTNAFSSSRGWSGSGPYIKAVSSFTNANGIVVGSITTQVTMLTSPYISSRAVCATTPSGRVIYRRVDCRLANSTKFPAGMVAKNRIDMNGNNVTTDSYDSLDVSKSTNNKYDSAKKQPNGDIASNDTITNTLDITIGNANIYGSVLTSPVGSVTMGPNGTIGPTFVSADRATTVGAAQSAGWVRNDFQVDIPDVTLPNGATSWTSQGNINNTTTLGTGDYRASGITLNSSETVTINGNVRIYITGNLSIGGNGQIKVNNGGTLTVYLAGTATIAGNGIANNSTSDLNLQLYGLNSSTSWTINGNGIWNGIVYAPYANLTMNGGGANGDMSGAIVAKSITMNGQVTFHYDEALRHSDTTASYDIASWVAYSSTNGINWVADR